MCDSFKCVNWEWRGGSGLIIFKVSSWNEQKKSLKILITNLNHYLSRVVILPRISSCYYFCFIQDVIWHRLSTIRFAVAAVVDARWDKDSKNCLEITLKSQCRYIFMKLWFLLSNSSNSDVYREILRFSRHSSTLIEKIEMNYGFLLCCRWRYYTNADVLWMKKKKSESE